MVMRKLQLGANLPGPPPAVASIPLPPLKLIQVQAPQLPPVSRDEVVRCYHALLRETFRREPRRPGQHTQSGDELQVNLLGFVDGKLVPGSARLGARLVLERGAGDVPGLAEALIDRPVGSCVAIQVAMPDSIPVSWAKGRPALFSVEVREAWRFVPPPEPELAPWRALNRGETLEAVMASIVADLKQARRGRYEIEVIRRMQDELLRQVPVEVPFVALEAELRRLFWYKEGPLLTALGVAPPEQQKALCAYLEDESRRTATERDMKLRVVYKSLAERDGLRYGQEDIDEALRLTFVGKPFEEVRTVMEHDKSLSAVMHNAAAQLAVTRHLLARTLVLSA